MEAHFRRIACRADAVPVSCFAGAAPPEDLPAVKTFRYATSGMGIEAFNRYQIKDTARSRFHNEQ